MIFQTYKCDHAVALLKIFQEFLKALRTNSKLLNVTYKLG